jgi:hypothetical protein
MSERLHDAAAGKRCILWRVESRSVEGAQKGWLGCTDDPRITGRAVSLGGTFLNVLLS